MNSRGLGSALDRLRTFSEGSDVAADVLVVDWQDFIADAVHRAVRASRAGHLCDEEDIRQCVNLALVVAARRGRLRSETPQQLAALIAKVAVNQVNAAIRAALADRRDARRTCPLHGVATRSLQDSHGDPLEAAAQNELRDALLERLDEAARRIVLKRGLGRSWHEIAAEEPRRMTPDAVRKLFNRAVRPLIRRFLRADAG